MEVKDLVGGHLLDGVEFKKGKYRAWDHTLEDCDTMRFRLDGVVYVAIEDPNDGYRSSLGKLTVSRAKTLPDMFDPIRVMGRHRTEGKYDQDDILELIEIATGKVILEVGTKAIDDYYPSFVAKFNREGL